jgi:hypothetical protein
MAKYVLCYGFAKMKPAKTTKVSQGWEVLLGTGEGGIHGIIR